MPPTMGRHRARGGGLLAHPLRPDTGGLPPGSPARPRLPPREPHPPPWVSLQECGVSWPWWHCCLPSLPAATTARPGPWPRRLPLPPRWLPPPRRQPPPPPAPCGPRPPRPPCRRPSPWEAASLWPPSPPRPASRSAPGPKGSSRTSARPTWPAPGKWIRPPSTSCPTLSSRCPRRPTAAWWSGRTAP